MNVRYTNIRGGKRSQRRQAVSYMLTATFILAALVLLVVTDENPSTES